MRRMLPLNPFAGAILLSLVTVAALAEPLSFAPQQGLLVLRNGRVLYGKITRAGDRYYVVRDDGELRINTDHVLLTARSLDEAYRLQGARITPGSSTGHLKLAAWCLDQHLSGYATQQLRAAQSSGATAAQLAPLRRRLDLAIRPQQPTPVSHRQTADTPSPQQLYQLAKKLPSGSVETFTVKIQPMLINSCATAGCHSSTGPSQFKLTRVATRQSGSQRVTLRNLYTVLKWIDDRQPAKSPLLTVPLAAHGSVRGPIFSRGQKGQYSRLASWVSHVSRHKADRSPSTVTPPPSAAGQSGDSLLQVVRPEGARSLGNRRQGATRAGSQHTTPSTAPKKPAPSASTSGRDPFDAEIFNRRFHAPPPKDAPSAKK
jgi:hypothetical protein